MATRQKARTRGRGVRGAIAGALDALHARLQDLPLVHVLFVVWEDPLITIGQNTFIADALRWAGAESVILSKQNWPQVSFEEVVRLQPEYIVLANSHTGEGQRSVAELRARPVGRNFRQSRADTWQSSARKSTARRRD